MNEPYDAVIIGAGHNGLITAAYLAKTGRRVLILERRKVIGGAAATEEVFPGFRFDTGAHRVRWFQPRVLRDLALDQHGLHIEPSDPALVSLQPDGEPVVLWRDPGQTAGDLQRFSAVDAGNWPSLVERLARFARFLEAVYSGPPPEPMGRAADLFGLLQLGAHLRLMGSEDMIDLIRTLPMTVAEFLDEWLESPTLKGALAASGITGLFQGPHASGTAYLLLHHHLGTRADGYNGGGWVPGGMGRLADALAAAARRHGADLRTGADVVRVLVQDGRAWGVVLSDGEEVRVRQAVISNLDPRRTFLGLVGSAHLDPEFVRNVCHIKARGAVAKLNLALDGLPAIRGLPADGPAMAGPFVVSPSLEMLERAYDDAKYGSPSRQPFLEITIPSALAAGMAPPGRHVMSVLAQYVPYHLREGAWDSDAGEALGDLVLNALGACFPGLENLIVHRQVLTPLDLETEYGLTEGNIYHGEMTLDQLLFMRPVPEWSRYRTPIAGLYLCGAGTHPGGGVSGAPGYNAARQVLKDIR